MVHTEHSETGRDLRIVLVESSDRTLEPLIQTAADEWSPSISPDGRWVAYSSDETGRNEVYVQRFPDLGDRRQISVGGGHRPQWSADGSELTYLRASQGPPEAIMSVAVTSGEGDPSSLNLAPAEHLTGYRYQSTQDDWQHHDLAPDGRCLVIISGGRLDDADSPAIVLVQNHAPSARRHPRPPSRHRQHWRRRHG